MKILLHSLVITGLTVLTQIGGLAWLLALMFRRRLLAFLCLYTVFSIATVQLAPLAGRVSLSCWPGSDLRVQSVFYCATNRHYVTPELRDALDELAAHMEATHPGTDTLVLDAGFPFLTGFPLLPHLSHDDGEKADLAFWYQDADGNFLPGRTRSPLGYFVFEQGQDNCGDRAGPLRWDMAFLQNIRSDWKADPARMRSALRWLSRDRRIGKIFIEPHLSRRLGIGSTKIRFQGCGAARHDDHIHVEL